MEHTGRFVSYIRVSTDKQGATGLGLDAQRRAIESYLNGGDWELVSEHVEVESGRNNDRPELASALAQCRAYNAILVIAKLDRLSRNAHFLLGLQNASVRFVAVDMPGADETSVSIMAVIAQRESKMIRARTKAALGSIKAEIENNGHYVTRAGRTITKLGNGRCTLTDTDRAKGGTNGRRARTAKAKRKAADLAPIIDRIKQDGVTSATGIARQLTAERVPLPSGQVGRWQPVQVQRVLSKVAPAA